MLTHSPQEPQEPQELEEKNPKNGSFKVRFQKHREFLKLSLQERFFFWGSSETHRFFFLRCCYLPFWCSLLAPRTARGSWDSSRNPAASSCSGVLLLLKHRRTLLVVLFQANGVFQNRSGVQEASRRTPRTALRFQKNKKNSRTAGLLRAAANTRAAALKKKKPSCGAVSSKRCVSEPLFFSSQTTQVL